MPRTIDAETDRQVGVPKLRFPLSENACPFIFFNFVHLTTSQGGDGVSVSPESSNSWLLRDPWREWFDKNAGDAARGELYVGPGTTVYQGMIVGIYNRSGDLDVNVCRGKQLTNMRTSSSDGTIQLTPFTDLSLEQSIDFIEDDELLEVTPKSLRLRKRFLYPNQRKRNQKN